MDKVYKLNHNLKYKPPLVAVKMLRFGIVVKLEKKAAEAAIKEGKAVRA
jgi:hypothetical protein